MHLHGSASLPQYDGYASDMTHPGRVQGLPLPEHPAARTLWYHDHGVHHTAENAYMGLRRPVPHPRRPTSSPSPCPRARYDVPLILRDAIFAKDGSLICDDSDESGPLRRRDPGQRRAVAEDEGRAPQVPLPRAQRLDLPLLPPRAEHRRAPDRGRHRRRADAPAPQARRTSGIGMAERYEMVIDFAKYPVGDAGRPQEPRAPQQRRTSTPRAT